MASEGVAALLHHVAVSRALVALATLDVGRVAYLVEGGVRPNGGVGLLVRGQPWRVGPWLTRARLYREVARELGTEGRRAIEPVRCGLCGCRVEGSLQAWAVAHPLTLPGLRRGDL